MIQIAELFTVPTLNTKVPNDLKRLKKLCLNLSKKKVSVIKSNAGGYQSPNLLDKPDKVISEFTKSLETPMRVFSSSLRIKKDIKMSNLWVNVNKPGCSNKSHMHPQAIISGVYYVSTPKDSGDLIFENPIGDLMSSYLPKTHVNSYDRYNSSAWHISPKDGFLILFPSWLRHSVDVNNSKEDRISISFNYSF
jgi:uncharacterized protein (TIGR02466 family)